jgi:uncharacterized repeat protein (TIGR01451 family)
VGALAIVVALLAPTAAQASFPGSNGKIVFAKQFDGIWTTTPDGTVQLPLTSNRGDRHPAWSADGQKIAFSRPDDNGNRSIFTMHADGTNVTQVTAAGHDHEPAWSPDGQKLAFSRQNRQPCDSSSFNCYRSIYSVNADGTGLTRLTTPANPNALLRSDFSPVWSPDGSKIAFTGELAICTINPAGSDRACLPFEGASFPDWSPDGSRFAYAGVDLYTVKTDGTDKRFVTQNDPFNDDGLAFSPDGGRIAYVFPHIDGHVLERRLHVVDVDGDNHTDLGVAGIDPDWQPLHVPGDVSVRLTDSPDPVASGQTITYTAAVRNHGTTAVNGVTLAVDLPERTVFASATPSQGSCSENGGTVVCNLGELDVGATATVQIQVDQTDATAPFQSSALVVPVEPDPNPRNNFDTEATATSGYPRPAAGAAMRLPLAIAYEPCEAAAANRAHSGGLVAPACNPAVQSSPYLTVGTLNANGAEARSAGFVRFTMCLNGTAEPPCDFPPFMSVPDVRLQVHINDVRCRLGSAAGQGGCEGGALSDYTGHLELTTPVRITDKNNEGRGRSNEPATVVDLPISVPVFCFADPAGGAPTEIGSNCDTTTSLDGVIPGSVQGGKRAIWQFDQVYVSDGGPDGDLNTADSAVFARQGVFVP